MNFVTKSVWSGMSGSNRLSDKWTVAAEHGAYVRFMDGKECLDANSGLWNVSLGYGHPAVREAIVASLDAFGYAGQFRRSSTIAEEFTQALLALWPDNIFDRVLFATSGSAANDLVMKLARLWADYSAASEKQLMASFTGSYHGQTFGALGLSDEYLMQSHFLSSDASRYRRLSRDNAVQVAESLDRWGDRLAAVFIEPVQGTGNRSIPTDVLDAVFAARNRHGFLIVADEVATGFGRTGVMMRSSLWSESPDIVVVSKALTNGTSAMSCVLCSPRVSEEFVAAGRVFPHGETQAGSAVSCAAALGVLRAYRDEFEMTTVSSKYPAAGKLRKCLTELQLERRGITVRGEGNFMTVDLPEAVTGATPVEDLREEGLIVHGGEAGMQLAPPLVLESADWDRLTETLDDYLRHILGE